MKNIEAKLSAISAQSDNNGEKDTQIADQYDCESRLSDVSSDENVSDNEAEENGGKTVSFSFKDLVKGDELSGSGENSNIEKLNKLSSDFEAKEVYGHNVHDNLANMVNLGMKACFSNTATKDLMSKYQVPQNCEFLRVPLINPELWNSESLQDSYRDNDKLMYKNQKLITKAMVPIVQIMNACLEKNDSVNNRLFVLASDAFSMMAYAHRDQSNIRRQLLKPAVSKPYRKLCNASTPVTENLFGDDLHKQIKDMNESRKFANNISHNKSSSKRRSTSSSNFGFKKPRIDYRSRNESKQKSFLGSKARQYSKSSKTQGSGQK